MLNKLMHMALDAQRHRFARQQSSDFIADGFKDAFGGVWDCAFGSFLQSRIVSLRFWRRICVGIGRGSEEVAVYLLADEIGRGVVEECLEDGH